MSRYPLIDGERIKTRVVDEDEYVVIDIISSQVQPDVDDLIQNMEDNEGSGYKRVEFENLGKLEYSLDYDFQKQEVRIALINYLDG